MTSAIRPHSSPAHATEADRDRARREIEREVLTKRKKETK
jgi:hypothetical protein